MAQAFLIGRMGQAHFDTGCAWTHVQCGVEIDRAELVERFRDMSDEELLANIRNELTDVARELAVAEATLRAGELPIDEDYDVGKSS